MRREFEWLDIVKIYLDLCDYGDIQLTLCPANSSIVNHCHIGILAHTVQSRKQTMHIRKTLMISTLLLLAISAHAEKPINANTASEEALNALPLLSAELVAAIVANRPYATWGNLNADLENSLSEEDLEELYARLYVPLKLNSAADADIQLIPGVGRRMAHEFEEYRPYTSMDQFRREIGKYVDAEEVARYEQYVVLE
jgi:DNA uptake protein ComE-like DNA-binding protein